MTVTEKPLADLIRAPEGDAQTPRPWSLTLSGGHDTYRCGILGPENGSGGTMVSRNTLIQDGHLIVHAVNLHEALAEVALAAEEQRTHDGLYHQGPFGRDKCIGCGALRLGMDRALSALRAAAGRGE